MLTPDDDNQDGAPGSEPGPEEATTKELTASTPDDFYEWLAPLLQLCAVANFLLLGRTADPVPRAITELTGFNLAAAARISRVRDSASLGRLLLEEPFLLYDYLLVGQLVFESPLFDHVRQLLADYEADDNDAVADSLRAFVAEWSEAFLGTLAHSLEQHSDQDVKLRRLRLQSIFARLAHTLVPVQLPQAADGAEPTADAAGNMTQLRLSFPPIQLQALQAALTLPEWLDDDPGHAFTHAIIDLASLRHTAIASLHQRLQALSPDEPTGLTLNELGLLYQAAQVYALALVTGALDGSETTASLFATDATTTLPDYCAELEHFVELVQATFPNEPSLVAVRREVEALAALL